jgi:heparin/heparan-sulfate lyase
VSKGTVAQAVENILPKELTAKIAVPIPPNEHLRLFIRKKHIPLIKKSIESDELEPIWQRIVETSKDDKHSRLVRATTEKGNFDNESLRVAKANALLFVVDNDKKNGRKAIDIMTMFFKT